MHQRFASINDPGQHAFAFDSDAWQRNGTPQVNSSFRMYQTYGDGLTQHSQDWPVTREHMADYLLSLAQAMLADQELADRLLYTLTRGPNEDEIAFAASVVFKPIDEEHPWERKTRYFSVKEKKISSSDAKQHDKRYECVERCHDGSPMAIYRMLTPEYADGLERYQIATAIRDWVFKQPDGANQGRMYMALPALFLEWTKEPDWARELMRALEAAQNVCKASQMRHAAQNTIDSVKRNIERHKEQKAAEGKESAA